MIDLTQMTVTELKHYLSENRSDDDKFSEALAELLKRDPNPVIYSKDVPLEEQERIFMEKITKH
jgi:cephalosporin-C deacetylase-like acetyl esterase